MNYADLYRKGDFSVAMLWANFAGIVLPPDAGPSQREDMRRAFYAGFVECFVVIGDLSKEFGVEEAAGALEKLDAEARGFFAEMSKRHGGGR